MEGTVPSAQLDKSKVLDVKPLRSLRPVLPPGPQAPPFVCAPPSGPFPPGFSPFYPFSAPELIPDINQNNTQRPPASFTSPIQSFRSPDVNFVDGSNGGVGPSFGKEHRASTYRQKKPKKIQDSDFSVGISSFERDDGNRQVVMNVLMRFDALRRRISQIEDAKESSSGLIKRADLKACNVLMSKGVRTNMRKRVGDVPGVEIGDIFFCRMELCLVGLHAQSMSGIDYTIMRGDFEEEPVAVSIISAGGYDDVAEDSDVLIYSGQGGNASRKGEQAADQKLERGNLSLERSLRRASEVRVIRGMTETFNQSSKSSKVYIYDGLYTVRESWTEKGKSGCNIFKYKLVRVPGQPGAFSVWKLIQRWKDGLAGRVGLILPDISSGAESVPVAIINDVDDDKGPAYFTYLTTVKYSKSFRLTPFGCNCHSACGPGNPNCSCIQKNGGDFPYTVNGVLVSRKPLIYECGPSCPCSRDCKSKVSQAGLKVRLDVFKTKDRGWGLRSLDPIRAGTFICEYAGEVVDKVRTRQDGEDGNDDYVFDTTRTYDLFKWNYEPGLIEDDDYKGTTEEYDIPYPLVISAKNVGNVARFMNHSCSPNVFWQPVIFEQNNESFVHIAFFALRHVAPMTELTYDYGISQSDEGNYERHRKKKCLCGSPKCRGYFG